MAKGVIGIIDSGIGGLSVLKEMIKRVKGETFVYLGDNENVPYGNKSDRELLSLVNFLLLEFSPFKLKCIILACNTLSLTVRKRVEEIAGVPVFGVFPPVEYAFSGKEKFLLLATERSCEKFTETENLKILPCKSLAGDIERYKFSLNKVNLDAVLPDNVKNIFGINTVILGCTHYVFLQNRILDHFNAEYVTSGVGNTVKMLYKWLKLQKNREKSSKNSILFVGKSAHENEKFWKEVVLKYY